MKTSSSKHSRILRSSLGLAAMLAFGALIMSGCNNVEPRASAQISNGQKIAVGGQVVYRDKDGGFYGILADNGGQYEPIQLDQQFHTDGARIRIVGTLDPAHLGKHGWGNIVDIQNVVAQ